MSVLPFQFFFCMKLFIGLLSDFFLWKFYCIKNELITSWGVFCFKNDEGLKLISLMSWHSLCGLIGLESYFFGFVSVIFYLILAHFHKKNKVDWINFGALIYFMITGLKWFLIFFRRKRSCNAKNIKFWFSIDSVNKFWL